MSVACDKVSPPTRADGLCLLHALPGRMRVHLPGWTAQQAGTIEARFRRVPGVRCAQANPLTGNVLIHFDSARTDETRILSTVHNLEPHQTAARADVTGRAARGARRGGTPLPPAVAVAVAPSRQRAGQARGRAVENDPDGAQPLIDQLARHPGVQVRADPRTQRVQVEFDARDGTIGHLLAAIIDRASTATDRPAADRPGRLGGPVPLRRGRAQARDATPTPPVWLLPVEDVVPGASSTAVRRHEQGLPAGGTAGGPAPWRLWTLPVIDLVCSTSGLVSAAASLARASSPLGLLLAGAELVHVCSALLARRTARHRDEARGTTAVAIAPRAAPMLQAGGRAPLALAAPQMARPGGTALGAARSRSVLQ